MNELALFPAVDDTERARRLAMHAAGQHCDACGTTHYPHERGETP